MISLIHCCYLYFVLPGSAGVPFLYVVSSCCLTALLFVDGHQLDSVNKIICGC